MTKADEISPEELRRVLRYDPETGHLFWLARDDARPCWNGKHAGKRAFTYVHKNGYFVGTFQKTSLRACRVIWALVHGDWPKGEIDHVNGDRSDDRLVNLRDVSSSDNSRNRATRRDNKSGHNGVCWLHSESAWVAQIMHNGRNHRVGTYRSKRFAIAARAAAEREFGYHENHGRPAKAND